MRTLLFVLVLGLAGSIAGRAQSYEDLAMRHQQPQSYHEAVALPAGAQARVVVLFRVPNPMLVFVRNRQREPGRAFVAAPRVTVRVYRAGQPIAEQVWQESHYAATFEETRQHDVDLEGAVSFDLAPGRYAYRLQLNDEQAGREQVSDLRAVTVPDFQEGHLGAPLLASDVHVSETTVRADLVNLGGDVPYGQASTALLPLGRGDRDASGLRYVLRAVLDKEAGAMPTDSVVVEGVVAGADWIPVWRAGEALWGTGEVHWPVAVAQDTPAGYLVPIDLQGATLADGAYVLETTLVADETETTTFRFRTHWRNRPISLYHPEVALRNLRFIEDRQVVKQLRRGTRAEQTAAVQAYWAARDPTPETPFNELMSEYYRRVDYAADAFRTGRSAVPDGLQTDQASVYIVYGPPEEVERTFPDGGGVRETWMYAERQFVFWAAGSLDPFRLEYRTSR